MFAEIAAILSNARESVIEDGLGVLGLFSILVGLLSLPF